MIDEQEVRRIAYQVMQAALADVDVSAVILAAHIAADDHTGYALLAGRSGGQTLKGGTAAGDDLTLSSTSHATKGPIVFEGVYPPADGGLGNVELLTTSSTKTGATNEGLRKATIAHFDTKTDDIDNAMLLMDVIQRTNPGAGTIKKTGIHVKIHTQPDNGGDTSGGLFVSTGGGGALTAYKTHTLRPAGFTNYQDSPQGALEVGTADQAQAGLFISGMQVWGAHTNASNAIYARLDSDEAKGIIIAPGDASFDTRVALMVGSQNINAADGNPHFRVLLDGTTTIIAPGGGTNGNTTFRSDSSKFRIDTADAVGHVVTLVKSRSDGAASNSDVIGDYAWNFYNSTPAEVQGATVRATVVDNTAGSEDTSVSVHIRRAGSVEETMQLSLPADGETAMLILRNKAGAFSLERVSMGAVDSGGSGFKVLRVPN